MARALQSAAECDERPDIAARADRDDGDLHAVGSLRLRPLIRRGGALAGQGQDAFA